MSQDRLTTVKTLMVSLYSSAELVEFAVLWLGSDFQPVGQWFAGTYAFSIAQELERKGMLRDKVFWDAIVLERPQREEDIRAVQRIFIPPAFRVHAAPPPDNKPPRALRRQRSSRSRSIEGLVGPRILLTSPAAFRIESPLLEASRSLNELARRYRVANRLADVVDTVQLIEIPSSIKDFERAIREAVRPTMAMDALSELLPRGY